MVIFVRKIIFFSKNKIKFQWFIFCIVVIIWCCFLLKNLDSSRNQTDFSKLFQFPMENSATTEEYLRKFTPKTLSKKFVTKSLKELGKMDEINQYFLFLNFIPKSGAEILIFLLERIQGLNSFKHVRLKGGGVKFLEESQETELVSQIYAIRKNEAVPLTFDKNVYFINFTKYDRQSPTYINLIRDPIEKVFSDFPKYNPDEIQKCIELGYKNCIIKNPEKYDFSIPYFCGKNPKCMKFNDPWALKTAKENVKRFYPVLGIMENLNSTLEVLEAKLPYFFKGSKKLYNKYLYGIYKQRKKPNISEKIRKTVEKVLETEVQFYRWAKKRLNIQFKKITTKTKKAKAFSSSFINSS